MRIKTESIKPNRWRTFVVGIIGIIIFVATIPVAAAGGIEDLLIDNIDPSNLVPGENFQINFSVCKPLSFGPLDGIFYTELGFIEYYEVPGSVDYVENKTEYTLSGVVNPNLAREPLIRVKIYWKINLDNSYSPSSPEEGDNLIVTINNEEYSATVVNVEENRYFIKDSPGLDIYVYKDEPNYLYVTVIDSYPLHGDYPPTTGWGFVVAVAATVVMIILVSMVVLKRTKWR